jgi:hypothetical protein
MVLLQFSPEWFYQYSILIEFAFAVVSLIISLLSLRIYKKTCENSVKLFGIAFVFISLSYFIQTAINFLILSKMNENVSRFIKLQSVLLFNNAGMIVHIFLMTIGLALLLYTTTFKAKEPKLLWLFILLSLLGIFLNENLLFMFYLFSTIYLAFISWHFLSNFLKNKKATTMFVAIAFIFLLFGNFHFIISVNHHLFYVIGHLLGLFAYILILANLYMVFKK